jgi:hypothetical protein
MAKPGIKINPLPVLFLAGSEGNTFVSLQGPGEMFEIC